VTLYDTTLDLPLDKPEHGNMNPQQ